MILHLTSVFHVKSFEDELDENALFYVFFFPHPSVSFFSKSSLMCKEEEDRVKERMDKQVPKKKRGGGRRGNVSTLSISKSEFSRPQQMFRGRVLNNCD